MPIFVPARASSPGPGGSGHMATARDQQVSAVGEGLLPDRLHGRTVGFQILHVVPAILRPSSDSSSWRRLKTSNARAIPASKPSRSTDLIMKSYAPQFHRFHRILHRPICSQHDDDGGRSHLPHMLYGIETTET
jgi:hypothetical protein